MASDGTTNAAIVTGGRTDPPADPGSGYASSATEIYDGISWNADAVLTNPNEEMAGMGSVNAFLAAGGQPAVAWSGSYEFNGTAWSVGGALGTARYGGAGAGTQNAALLMGGWTGAPSPNYRCETEHYDGSAWTAGGNMITARATTGGAGSEYEAFVAASF